MFETSGRKQTIIIVDQTKQKDLKVISTIENNSVFTLALQILRVSIASPDVCPIRNHTKHRLGTDITLFTLFENTFKMKKIH